MSLDDRLEDLEFPLALWYALLGLIMFHAPVSYMARVVVQLEKCSCGRKKLKGHANAFNIP